MSEDFSLIVGLEFGLQLTRRPPDPLGENGGTENVVTAMLLRRGARRPPWAFPYAISGSVEGRRGHGRCQK